MSIQSQPATQVEPVRGSMLLHDEDAVVFQAIVKHLANSTGKAPKTTDIIRDSLRCYAEKLNVSV